MRKILLQATLVLAGALIGTLLAPFIRNSVTYARFAQSRSGYFWFAMVSGGVSENQFDSKTKDASEFLLKALAVYENGVHSPHLDAAMKNALRMKIAAGRKGNLQSSSEKPGIRSRRRNIFRWRRPI